MPIIFLLLFIHTLSWAQMPAPSGPPFLSETLEQPLPGELPESPSPFEQAVESAQALPESKKEVTKKTSKKKSANLRDDSLGTVMLGYQLIASWVPSKVTASYTHIFNANWSLEGEFSYSKLGDPIPWVDLASIIERRYTLQARRFVGNSFNFSFGAVLSEFTANLDASFSGQGIDTGFSSENIGVTLGLGNRWQWPKGVTFGIDWFRLNIPIYERKADDQVLDDLGAGDQNDVKKTIRRFNRIPTFVLFGLNIGYTF